MQKFLIFHKWIFLASRLKKFLYFPKWNFLTPKFLTRLSSSKLLTFPEIEFSQFLERNFSSLKNKKEPSFSVQTRNLKNMTPREFLILQENGLSNCNIKKLLIFFQKKAILMFWETTTPKNCLYFRKRNFFIFQETSYILESNFPSSKIAKNPLLKSFLYFRK